MSDSAEPALLRVVKGEPTDEELAALVVVIAARRSAAAGQEASDVRRSGWTDRARELRGGHRHGPGGWRAAALPR
ncbi:MAG: acyl-CoA carboxylase subunit epsilon [Nocardioidaceae bacterium]